jgi:hypothetical protein
MGEVWMFSGMIDPFPLKGLNEVIHDIVYLFKQKMCMERAQLQGECEHLPSTSGLQISAGHRTIVCMAKFYLLSDQSFFGSDI